MKPRQTGQAACRGMLCIMLCALLTACYRPDQQKLEEEVRALVRPGMKMADAEEGLVSRGFDCSEFFSDPQGQKQPSLNCRRHRGWKCDEQVNLQPADYVEGVSQDPRILAVVHVLPTTCSCPNWICV